MSLTAKALVFGGIGCLISATFGLSQSISSLTIKEQLLLEGYEIISESEKVDKEVWKERAKLYKQENQNLMLNGLSAQEVEKDENKLLEECKKYTNGKRKINSIKEGVYEKLIKLCTLKIKEYIKLNLNKKDGEKIINKEEESLWKENFNKHKDEIIKEIKEINVNNSKDKLFNFCESAYALQKSNKNKDKEYQANKWCVKKNEKPSSPPLKK